MLSRISQRVYCPGMDRDIANYVNNCHQCRLNAPPQSQEPLVTLPISHYPFWYVVVDLF